MDKKITLFIDKECPFCIASQEYLKDNGVVFDIIDIDDNIGRWLYVLEMTGFDVTPTLQIDNNFYLPTVHFNNVVELFNLTIL